MNQSMIVRSLAAAFVWAGLALPAALVATAQEATPAGAMQMATPIASTAPIDAATIEIVGSAVNLT